MNHQLFAESPMLRVRDITLSATDDLGAYREKLAPFVLGSPRRCRAMPFQRQASTKLPW
jgi:hypothetical protein